MIISKVEFIAGAVELEKMPVLNKPEIGFIGRSNVGKSSLINSIVMRKNIAHTSSAPGKTREINFYLVENRWVLVDMPGFGYATIGKTYKELWSKLNFAYLESREPLRLVCILMDSRHDPMEIDLALVERLENIGRKYAIILTKCDKLSKQAIIDREEQVRNIVSQCKNCVDVLPYSSVNGTGRRELIGIINNNSSL